MSAGPGGEQALHPSIVSALVNGAGGLPTWLQRYACSREDGVRAAAFSLLDAVLSVDDSGICAAQRAVISSFRSLRLYGFRILILAISVLPVSAHQGLLG